jgi:hypothetical protein
MNIYGNVLINVWICMDMYGYVWICMECMDKCMDMYGYVWICMDMYG